MTSRSCRAHAAGPGRSGCWTARIPVHWRWAPASHRPHAVTPDAAVSVRRALEIVRLPADGQHFQLERSGSIPVRLLQLLRPPQSRLSGAGAVAGRRSRSELSRTSDFQSRPERQRPSRRASPPGLAHVQQSCISAFCIACRG